MSRAKLLESAIASGAGVSVENPGGGKSTFQAVGYTTAGAGSATILIEVSNNGVNWLPYDTISLTLSTTPATAGVEMDAPWSYVRGNVTAISGTGATVSLHTGV